MLRLLYIMSKFIRVFFTVGLAFGLKESSFVNNIFTLLNVAVVVFVIIAGSIKGKIIIIDFYDHFIGCSI